ncbi:tumor necrosis factor ligand superfamily member 15 [Dendropsophus ebraccatus]|uniref:tumor necrosis factor ligand superfamily member 15 n=1 Tax=Dendropsophus ebraccatus TaxID=150705 RepID=UPI003831FEED
METNIEMLPEERNQVTSRSHSLHAQDKSIRRLTWAVAICFILLSALVLLTFYLLRGDLPCEKDKVTVGRYTGAYQDPDSKPKAHLTVTKQTDASGDLHWEHTRGLAFLENGMEYCNKSIVIPRAEYYFVYSQVSFRPQGTCADDKPITLKIIRSNSNYPQPEIILSGVSFCTKSRKIYQPIYLGGLLQLQSGDQLKVNVDPVTPIDTSVDHKTFFGVFLV